MAKSKKKDVPAPDNSQVFLKTGTGEPEFVIIVNHIMDQLAADFIFGHYDIDDIRQEGFQMALEGIDSYDRSRPLDNFLYVHIYNRLFNLQRNKSYRYDPPCNKCPLFDKGFRKSENQCLGFANKMDCEKYERWAKRNAAKKAIMTPVHFSSLNTEGRYDRSDLFEYYTDKDIVIDETARREMINMINEKLNPALRGIFLRMTSNIKVKRHEKTKVQEAIAEIIVTSGAFPEVEEFLRAFYE